MAQAPQQPRMTTPINLLSRLAQRPQSSQQGQEARGSSASPSANPGADTATSSEQEARLPTSLATALAALGRAAETPGKYDVIMMQLVPDNNGLSALASSPEIRNVKCYFLRDYEKTLGGMDEAAIRKLQETLMADVCSTARATQPTDQTAQAGNEAEVTLTCIREMAAEAGEKIMQDRRADAAAKRGWRQVGSGGSAAKHSRTQLEAIIAELANKPVQVLWAAFRRAEEEADVEAKPTVVLARQWVTAFMRTLSANPVEPAGTMSVEELVGCLVEAMAAGGGHAADIEQKILVLPSANIKEAMWKRLERTPHAAPAVAIAAALVTAGSKQNALGPGDPGISMGIIKEENENEERISRTAELVFTKERRGHGGRQLVAILVGDIHRRCGDNKRVRTVEPATAAGRGGSSRIALLKYANDVPMFIQINGPR